MLFGTQPAEVNIYRRNIRANFRADEAAVIESLLPIAEQDLISRTRIREKARSLTVDIRQAQVGKGGLDALLNEFSLSTEEGVVLMCLAEALLRVPDKRTIDRLIQDKLADADWAAHLGNNTSLFVNASTWGLLITGKLVGAGEHNDSHNNNHNNNHNNSYNNNRNNSQQLGLLQQTVRRLGEPVIRTAVRYALQIMGTQFVMGSTIVKALQRATKEEAKGYRYSYDMLGEAARTDEDAKSYLQSYLRAIEHIGKTAQGRGPILSPGISVKLSALHARYEFSQHARVMAELLPRLKILALAAKSYNIGFTIDAEEAERLDLSLDIIEALFSDPDLDAWEGFGFAIQAYQKRALDVVEWANDLAQAVGRKLMVRLVKGAYWDTEIKIAQTEGYSEYPVFTSKPATDVSYQACARKLLDYRQNLFPQFATHNAYTVATILEMAGKEKGEFEFQRLHGMGQALYEQEDVHCRIYAPVGRHADLLAYLVRRLLENGANSSFVNNIIDESIPVDSLLEDPVETVRSWACKRNAAIPLPADLYGNERRNSCGLDLSDVGESMALNAAISQWWGNYQQGLIQVRNKWEGTQVENRRAQNPANSDELVGYRTQARASEIECNIKNAQRCFTTWSKTPVSDRANILRRFADSLEQHKHELMALCVKEAGKTVADSIAEVREAVDFCRYYAQQAEMVLVESDILPRGIILCISPWNFPLAIFVGQVTAALAAGNTVVAKPSEQTSLIAIKAVELMLKSGLPKSAVELVMAPGRKVGAQVVPDTRIKGVMFTGSTFTGKWLAQTLAQRTDGPIPLIAETGGQNAMVVDSTALPEQVVDDVIVSGFQSAGQRCSALRVLFLQEDVAETIIAMIIGAMKELRVGNPMYLHTDLGPVIDSAALQSLHKHIDAMENKAKLLYRCELSADCTKGHFFAPTLYEIENLSTLTEEVFGPVVHIVRYKANTLDNVIQQINGSGFGLTMGIHSRIHRVRDYITQRAKVGNIYINRNMIGAVVGVQPFGGHAESGTGPKAGGPLYLGRLVQTPFTAQAEVAVTQPTVDAEKSKVENTVLESRSLNRIADIQHQWQYRPVVERVEKLRRFLSLLASHAAEQYKLDDGVLDKTTQDAEKILQQAISLLSAAQKLPGPTGESNQLVFESRGLLLSDFSQTDDFQSWVLGLIAALASGNAVVVVADSVRTDVVNQCCTWLHKAGVPASLCSVYSGQSDIIISTYGIDGVLLTPDSQKRNHIEILLAEREGQILPLICEPLNKFYLFRFIIEKTITEDITASGGNASLMTLRDEHKGTLNFQQTG